MPQVYMTLSLSAKAYWMFFKFYLFFNWWKIALQFCVGFCSTRHTTYNIYIYMYI